jgi:hypothetical protein
MRDTDSARIFDAFVERHNKLRLIAVFVVRKARNHVRVIVPHVLLARWLVVLANSNAIAVERSLHGNGDLPGYAKQMSAYFLWKFVDVLEMRNWAHEDPTLIAPLLMMT